MIFAASEQLPLAVDHAGYGVSNLSAVVELFRKLGFSPTTEQELLARDRDTGTFHPLGQRSAHLVFEHGYLELSAPTRKVENNHLIPLVERYEGLHILALATSDAEQQRQRYSAWHPNPAPVAQASRSIEYGKDPGLARFKWFPLPAEVFPEGIVCCVEHLSRGRVFQREVLSHPNGVSGLLGVMLLSPDPQQAQARYEPFTNAEHGIPRVHERARLHMLPSVDAVNDALGLTLPRSDILVGLELETRALTTLKDILKQNRVGFFEYQQTGVIVPLPALNSFLYFRSNG